jgi:hypothetical protein
MQTRRPPVTATSTRAEVLVATGLLIAATGLVAAVDPHEGGHYPGCPFLALTGLYCPLCGGLRAVHDLTRLDVVDALARNPLVVLALPVVMLFWFRWVRRTLTGQGRPRSLPSWWGWAVLAVLAVFWVARNLPGMTWLSPA